MTGIDTSCEKCGAETKFSSLINEEVKMRDTFEEGALFMYFTTRKCTKCFHDQSLVIVNNHLPNLAETSVRGGKGRYVIKSNDVTVVDEYIEESE